MENQEKAEEEEAHINLPAELKIVVIGEAACGKSTLINSYAQVHTDHVM
jgi:GTPase SAR1 family protein